MDVEPFLNCDHERDSARAALGLDSSHIVVGKIARLFQLKGHDDVIEAARVACASNDKLRFLSVRGRWIAAQGHPRKTGFV